MNRSLRTRNMGAVPAPSLSSVASCPVCSTESSCCGAAEVVVTDPFESVRVLRLNTRQENVHPASQDGHRDRIVVDVD